MADETKTEACGWGKMSRPENARETTRGKRLK